MEAAEKLAWTWQTKGRYLVWKMEAAEKARWDLENKGRIFGLENGSSRKG
jgi:hypothetical protein